MRRYFLVVTIGVLLAALCDPVLPSSIADAQTLATDNNTLQLPVFPYAQGWLGADDAYSIPLSPHKSLWLFGDTFVAGPQVTLRKKAATMVHNTIGISTCEPGSACTMHYYWRKPLSDHPRAFFDTGRNDQWYWPMDGFLDGKTVYLSLMTVRHRAGAKPEDPFGFEITGTVWARVTNLSAPPDQWRIAIKPLTHGNLWAGDSIIPYRGFVLFYSQVSEGSGKGYMIVLRAPLAGIRDPAAHWQYLAANHKWRAVTPDMDPLHVIDQGISEMTVRYHPASKEWIAISPGPQPLSKYVVARIAHTPTGPWSPPQRLFEFPEMNPRSPLYDKGAFCYATKEHTEFSKSKLVLTYACNSSFSRTLENMKIYRPQVVVVNPPKLDDPLPNP
jgi:Domain of unknown function (DUF4185)